MRRVETVSLVVMAAGLVAWSATPQPPTTPDAVTADQLASILGITVLDYEIPEDCEKGTALVFTSEEPGNAPEELSWFDAQGYVAGDRVRIALQPLNDGMTQIVVLGKGTVSRHRVQMPPLMVTLWPPAWDGIHQIGSDGVILRTAEGYLPLEPSERSSERETVLRVQVIHGRI